MSSASDTAVYGKALSPHSRFPHLCLAENTVYCQGLNYQKRKRKRKKACFNVAHFFLSQTFGWALRLKILLLKQNNNNNPTLCASSVHMSLLARHDYCQMQAGFLTQRSMFVFFFCREKNFLQWEMIVTVLLCSEFGALHICHFQAFSRELTLQILACVYVRNSCTPAVVSQLA